MRVRIVVLLTQYPETSRLWHESAPGLAPLPLMKEWDGETDFKDIAEQILEECGLLRSPSLGGVFKLHPADISQETEVLVVYHNSVTNEVMPYSRSRRLACKALALIDFPPDVFSLISVVLESEVPPYEVWFCNEGQPADRTIYVPEGVYVNHLRSSY